MNRIESGVVKTIVYADLFDFPLTKTEIFNGYIGNKPIAKTDLEKALMSLVDNQVIETAGGYYFLPGKQAIVRWRKSRLLTSTQKYVKAKQMAGRLIRLPGVMGVAISGSVAIKNADDEDDIDLMIVARSGQLWSTRLWVTSYLDLLGKRRKPDQASVRDKFCTNLYVDEEGLVVPVETQNLYTAHEVAQVIFVEEKDMMAKRFLQANKWIKKYLPNIVIPNGQFGNYKKVKANVWEWLSYRLQKWYMKKRMTRELVSPSQAYFHPNDLAKIIMTRYHRALRDYGIEKS